MQSRGGRAACGGLESWTLYGPGGTTWAWRADVLLAAVKGIRVLGLWAAVKGIRVLGVCLFGSGEGHFKIIW